MLTVQEAMNEQEKTFQHRLHLLIAAAVTDEIKTILFFLHVVIQWILKH